MSLPANASDPPPPIDDPADSPTCLCGYNLRGLPADGRCPECAHPIAASLAHQLRAADPLWLAAIIAGCGWALWGFAARVPFGILVYAWPANRSLTAALFITQIVAYYGVWRISASEPRDPHPLFNVLARSAASTYLIARPVLWLGSISLPVEFIGGLIVMISGLTADVASAILVSRLAARIPHLRLARHWLVLAVLQAVIATPLVAISVMSWIAYFSGVLRPFTPGLDAALNIASLAVAIFFNILRALLLYNTRRALLRLAPN
jgi:hypothetical protein